MFNCSNQFLSLGVSFYVQSNGNITSKKKFILVWHSPCPLESFNRYTCSYIFNIGVLCMFWEFCYLVLNITLNVLTRHKTITALFSKEH